MKKGYLDVDVAGLCSVIHTCTGCDDLSGHCCSRYEITITGKELLNIIQYLPLASALCPHLESGNAFDNVFDEISRGLYSIDTDDEGTCLFAYSHGTKLRCSLHSVAEQLGIPFGKVKPAACLLWPLALFEGETEVLTLHEDAFEFSCNRPGRKEGLSLCPSIAGNVEDVFGGAFREQLQDAVNQGLIWTRISLP